jgi:hypothetical protein
MLKANLDMYIQNLKDADMKSKARILTELKLKEALKEKRVLLVQKEHNIQQH